MSLAAFPPQIIDINEHGFVWANDKQKGKNLMLSSVTQHRLKQLWQMTTDPAVKKSDWSYKQCVIQAAQEIFRVYPSLLSALHLRSIVLQPSHYEFLIDCCRFLETGQRDMSVNHWNTVLTYEDWPGSDIEDDTPRQREERLRGIAQRLKVNHESHGLLIAQWCRQPHGYVDLAYTLKMLFLAQAR